MLNWFKKKGPLRKVVQAYAALNGYYTSVILECGHTQALSRRSWNAPKELPCAKCLTGKHDHTE